MNFHQLEASTIQSVMVYLRFCNKNINTVPIKIQLEKISPIWRSWNFDNGGKITLSFIE